MIARIVLAQEPGSVVREGAVLLDSTSSCDFFGEAGMPSNILPTNKVLKLRSNAREIKSDEMGMHGHQRAWHQKDCIANVLSLSEASKKCRVVMESMQDNAMCVQWTEGAWHMFKLVSGGLHGHVPGKKHKKKLSCILRACKQ